MLAGRWRINGRYRWGPRYRRGRGICKDAVAEVEVVEQGVTPVCRQNYVRTARQQRQPIGISTSPSPATEAAAASVRTSSRSLRSEDIVIIEL